MHSELKYRQYVRIKGHEVYSIGSSENPQLVNKENQMTLKKKNAIACVLWFVNFTINFKHLSKHCSNIGHKLTRNIGQTLATR